MVYLHFMYLLIDSMVAVTPGTTLKWAEPKALVMIFLQVHGLKSVAKKWVEASASDCLQRLITLIILGGVVFSRVRLLAHFILGFNSTTPDI